MQGKSQYGQNTEFLLDQEEEGGTARHGPHWHAFRWDRESRPGIWPGRCAREAIFSPLPGLIILLGGAAGIWLFYIQHQFERTYWAPHSEWDPVMASLAGSSYYKLPKVIQWFSGNIGLHHIHHIRPRIPNHTLQRAFDEVPELREVAPITLWTSLRSLWLNLWDEQQQKMVSFRAVRKRRRQTVLSA